MLKYLPDGKMKSLQNASFIEEGSFRVAYFVEASLFAVLLFWKYDAFNERSRKEIVLLNMALLFCAMLFLFVRSENGGRVSWMFMIGIIASMTHIVTHPVHKNNALTGALVVLFFVLFFFTFFQPQPACGTPGDHPLPQRQSLQRSDRIRSLPSLP